MIASEKNRVGVDNVMYVIRMEMAEKGFELENVEKTCRLYIYHSQLCLSTQSVDIHHTHNAYEILILFDTVLHLNNPTHAQRTHTLLRVDS